MKKYSIYFMKTIWIVGFFLLIHLSLDFRNQLQQTAQLEFNIIPVLWFDVIQSILFGFYISLLLVKKWSININFSLLWCVAIPCLILLLIYPLIATLATYELLPENFSFNFMSTWLFQAIMSSSLILGVVTGITLIQSFFGSQSDEANV